MEPPVSIDIAKHALGTFGIILAVGSATGLLAQKTRVPDVALFLLAGMALGPHALGWVDVDADSALNQGILIFGACYILFDGGASLRLAVLKQVWISIALLATVGIVVTTLITGYGAAAMLGVPLTTGLLLAAVIAATDPATLVPVFRQVKIRDRVAQTVMSESAFNDATGAILTFALLEVAAGRSEFSVSHSLLSLLQQAGIGLIAGATLGYLAAMLIAHEKFNFFAEYAPLMTLMAVVAAYLGADGLQASGFMAVFVFGIVLGNKNAFGFTMEPGEAQKMDEYVAVTALIARMLIFILLGSQVDFTLMRQHAAESIAVVAVLMFVARPVTVFICTLPDRQARWTFKEMLFMCWTRETGVVPGALAGMLLGLNAPQAPLIASVTFVAILSTILLQATTTRWLARKLGLLEENVS